MLDPELRISLGNLLYFCTKAEIKGVSDYLHAQVYHDGGKNECSCQVMARNEHEPQGCSDDSCQCWANGYERLVYR